VQGSGGEIWWTRGWWGQPIRRGVGGIIAAYGWVEVNQGLVRWGGQGGGTGECREGEGLRSELIKVQKVKGGIVGDGMGKGGVR